MSFEEKISIILETNQLGIATKNKLEVFCDIGTSGLSKYDPEKGQPGKSTIKKLLEKLRINPVWWKTGEGSIYLGDNQQDAVNTKVLPMDAWMLLQDDNREFKKEIGNLWEMIHFLRGQGIKSHEGK